MFTRSIPPDVQEHLLSVLREREGRKLESLTTGDYEAVLRTRGAIEELRAILTALEPRERQQPADREIDVAGY